MVKSVSEDSPIYFSFTMQQTCGGYTIEFISGVRLHIDIAFYNIKFPQKPRFVEHFSYKIQQEWEIQYTN